MAKDKRLAEQPFSYRETRDGLVQISCSGRLAKTLRGKDAARFIARIETADADTAQLLMAKATGQFKFGNERLSKLKGRGQ